MENLLWPMVLLAVGLMLIALELFIPSGGVISIMASLCTVAAVAVAFVESVETGVIMLGVSATIIPAIVAAAVKWWPHTPLAKLILIGRPEDPDDVLPETEVFRGLQMLIGRRGITRSKMLPGGRVEIAGKQYDAISEGVPIEENEPVQVVQVRTHRLVVRRASGLPQDERQAEDVLSQSLDSLGIDDWDDSTSQEQ